MSGVLFGGSGGWGDNGVLGEYLIDLRAPPPPNVLAFTLLSTYLSGGRHGMHGTGPQGFSLSTGKPLAANSY